MSELTQRTLAAGVLALALAGCNLTGAMDPPAAFPAGVAKGKAFSPNSPAGLPITADPDPTKLPKLVALRDRAGAYGTVRSDPFALTADERIFETTQTSERVFGSGGGFGSVALTPKPEEDEQIVAPEAQPYRRLSGIVVGDSILAILEEDGRMPVIVAPGSQIPNSPWRVVSIDQEKAVLHRAGNVKPTQIIVRLETQRLGAGGNNAGGGGNGGGAPGGAPGGPPGGFGGGRGGPGGGD